MPPEKKIEAVAFLEDKLRRSSIAISAQYRGLKVAEMAALRRALRQQGIELQVVKNTLTSIAGDRAGKPQVKDILQGPSAIAFGYGEVVEPAKVLVEHIRTARLNMPLTGAIMDGQVLDQADVQALAATPPRPELIGKVMGGLMAPLYGLVYAMNYHIGGLARALEARRKQLEEAGG